MKHLRTDKYGKSIPNINQNHNKTSMHFLPDCSILRDGKYQYEEMFFTTVSGADETFRASECIKSELLYLHTSAADMHCKL